MTQKLIVYNYLKQRNDWVRSLELANIVTDWGHLGSEAPRRCRDLYAEGLVEKKRDGKYEYYRAKPSSIIQELNNYKLEAAITADGKYPKTIQESIF